VDVSGQLSADALYSALGEIADLSVNRLSTPRREPSAPIDAPAGSASQ